MTEKALSFSVRSGLILIFKIFFFNFLDFLDRNLRSDLNSQTHNLEYFFLKNIQFIENWILQLYLSLLQWRFCCIWCLPMELDCKEAIMWLTDGKTVIILVESLVQFLFQIWICKTSITVNLNCIVAILLRILLRNKDFFLRVRWTVKAGQIIFNLIFQQETPYIRREKCKSLS